MRKIHIGLGVALLAVLLARGPDARAEAVVPGVVRQQVAPLSDYGALPSLELVQLSPSGRRMAFVTVVGERRILALVNLADQSQLGSIEVGQTKVRYLKWIGEDRVMVTTSATETLQEIGLFRRELYTGYIYDPARGRVVTMLTGANSLLPILMGPASVSGAADPLVQVRAFSVEAPDRLDLHRVDPATGRARVTETMARTVDDYVLDASGRSVARSTYDEQTGVWSLLLRTGDDFRESWSVEAPLDAPTLVGLGMQGESVIVSADRPDLSREGREDATLFDVNLTTGVWRPVRFEFRPSDLLFHPVTRRLVGAVRVEEEGRRYAFSDQDAGMLWAAVEAAFPGQWPDLVSWSDDLNTAVVFTEGAGDAGSYHLVDLAEGSISPVGNTYKTIAPEQVAPVSTVSYVAGDGLEIRGYLTLPPGRDAKSLPLVVLAHGGPASRDVMGFDWWAQALASRGYAVLQSNFRGSTGYGDAFMEAGYGEWGRKMQTDLSDGVRHLAHEGVIDPKRVCIMGASYGGYAAMAGPTLDRGVYRCAVAVAGVSDLRQMVQFEASLEEKKDNGTVRYWNRFMGAERLGDRSLDERSPARLAAQADAPMLLIHGKDDSVVPVEQSRAMARALRQAGKPVELIELQGEDHWLSRGETRQRMLAESVRFLQANNPAD